MYKRIGDYGIIGNTRTAALVGKDGSIDWLCLPHLDSPSVFAALLDYRRGGRFAVAPAEPFDSTSRYLPGTNILETTFRTAGGRLRLTDFMPVGPTVAKKREEEEEEGVLWRCAEATKGTVDVLLRFAPRFDYGRAEVAIEAEGNGALARDGDRSVSLVATRPGLEVESGTVRARWRLRGGDRLWFLLSFGDREPARLSPEAGQRAMESTERYWRAWLEKSETGLDFDFGPFREMIERSSLVLKLLEFSPSGAMAAAATTSLPEEIGGRRNWDYRFTWIRDAAMTVEALFNIGHLAEMENYLKWLERFICKTGSDLQVLYGLRGETDLAEEELPHLEGYKGSRPVRIGNGAREQHQLDIYGEIMDAALRLSNYAGKIDFSMWPFFRSICDTVAARWREKDSGIWEVRGGPQHFVYSKAMCWVALDRGLTIARRYGFPGDTDRWETCREEIRREVLEKGWSEQRRSFVQHYDTDALDAANLLLPFYGFLPYDDERSVATAEAIREELTADGFVYRYRTADGVAGGEGTFLVCTFWLVDNLIGQGRLEEAMILLLRLERTATPLGLFAEEYDPFWKEPLGNVPQAFSHIGYINSVFALCRAREHGGKPLPESSPTEKATRKLLVAQRFLLNEGEADASETPGNIAAELKEMMNLLRGAFFRTAEGRVAYEEMDGSSLYERYVTCSRQLRGFDPGSLRSREEKLAFWINIYNVMVVHGVVALGIRDSVKEITRFFRRICYRIGSMEFSADDIEHGILRGNHRYPNSPFHPFDRWDPRSRLVIDPLDPRIHFALVCASSSCPPIEIYSAESLDHDLEVSGRTFLNSGGVRIDRERGTVRLPQVLHWYGEDFGDGDAEKLRFVAPYLYREEDRAFIEEHAARLKVKYQPYDWRLNRT